MLSAEVVLGVAGCAALASVLWLPHELEKRRARALLDELPSEARVVDMLHAWSNARRVPVFIDPQVSNQMIRFAACGTTLDWETTCKILSFHDIMIEEREVNGHAVVFARLRGHCSPKAELRANGYPSSKPLVTAVFQVKNGRGSDLFATLRCAVTRDIERLGDILYVRGSELIVVVDYPESVEWYRKVIKTLDEARSDVETRIIQLKFVHAQDMARAIDARFRCRRSREAPRVVGDDRGNQLVVVAREDDAEEIDAILRLSDRVPR